MKKTLKNKRILAIALIILFLISLIGFFAVKLNRKENQKKADYIHLIESHYDTASDGLSVAIYNITSEEKYIYAIEQRDILSNSAQSILDLSEENVPKYYASIHADIVDSASDLIKFVEDVKEIENLSYEVFKAGQSKDISKVLTLMEKVIALDDKSFDSFLSKIKNNCDLWYTEFVNLRDADN